MATIIINTITCTFSSIINTIKNVWSKIMHFLFVYEDDEEAVREREDCEFAIKFGKIAVSILLVIALFVTGVNIYKTYLRKNGKLTITVYCTSNTEHYDTDPGWADCRFTDELVEKIESHEIDLCGTKLSSVYKGDDYEISNSVEVYFDGKEADDPTVVDHLEFVGLEEYEKYDGTTDKRWVVDYKD